MTSLRLPDTARWREALPAILIGTFFVVLFWTPMRTLARDWWVNPDASHGLLLAPLALWLAWRRGLVPAHPAPIAGLTLLIGAVLLRWVSGLAVELFTMRASLVMAGLALILLARGWQQLIRWWLPIALLVLSIPLPEVVLSQLALPLQLRASSWGAALLEWRHVPVLLEGNIIQVPGRRLFVTEACSGLRSLTALTALGILVAGLWLRHPVSRVMLVLIAIPVAMVINSIRVFLTGFLVYYVNPALGEGFMHYSEGWVLFVVAFAVLGAGAWLLGRIERRLGRAA